MKGIAWMIVLIIILKIAYMYELIDRLDIEKTINHMIQS